MSKTLYVGNLPYTITIEELKGLFSGYNTEDVKVITDRDSGRSRGFGFVHFNYDGEAEKAIKALDGHSLGDRKIVVNEARPRTNRNSGGSDRSFNKPIFNRW
ncbi:RNA-binding protein [Candidatus Aerophobetes bacterium Ae_b3b]|nr:RNA-binding protein [Candidatus Aerophobetes bacterium]TKJ45593.1 MAG: RNA-binding protein [Candidatus Aerophobetes bacterium Ae_b3b]